MVVTRPALRRYALSVAVVVLATLARRLLDPVLGDRAPLVTYFLAVSISAWLGGFGPGLVTLILGGLTSSYFFMMRQGSFLPVKLDSQIGLGLYFFTGFIIILLAAAQRSARARAEASALEAEAEIARRVRAEREREGLLAEQARLRAVAEEQSATLATLLDQAPIAIVLYDTSLRHIRANSKATALIGLSLDRVIGRTIREVLTGLAPEVDIEELEQRYLRTIETGDAYSVKAWKLIVQKPGGDDAVYLDWSIRRVDRPEGGILGLLGTFVDVTEDIEREQALRQSEERFRLAAEAVNGLIYDADATTGHIERTRGLFELVGYQPEEVPPTIDWWLDQVHPDDLPALLEKDARRTSSGTRLESEYRVRHRDGHYLHVIDRSLTTNDESGQIIRYVGCTQDLTEIRQSEQSLREADSRKNEFLAVLAHEIRNPLASIRNSLRLMKLDDVQGHDKGQSIRVDLEAERAMAERQVAHLARLVDDLMDVSRISRGRVELRKEPVELARIVGRAVEAVRSSVDRRGHSLSIEMPTEPISLEADPTRLEQVVGNLLSNAVKYTPPGGRIQVSARRDNGEAILTVQDTGLGIAEEILPKVFEMFVQDGKHVGHAQGGLGIGLGLSKSLVELHGGRISARSQGAGNGSEFEVRLPIAPSRPKESGGTLPNGRSDRPSTAPRRRVLVVDDNEDVARSLAKVLERMYGQEVRVAHDGPAALELAEGFRPEVILLDIGMPVMDGLEVARRIRLRPEFAQTFVVALSGWGQESDRKRSEEAGIDRHVVKPVDPELLGVLIAGSRA